MRTFPRRPTRREWAEAKTFSLKTRPHCTGRQVPQAIHVFLVLTTMNKRKRKLVQFSLKIKSKEKTTRTKSKQVPKAKVFASCILIITFLRLFWAIFFCRLPILHSPFLGILGAKSGSFGKYLIFEIHLLNIISSSFYFPVIIVNLTMNILLIKIIRVR